MNNSTLYQERITSKKTEALFLSLTILLLWLLFWRASTAGADALAVICMFLFLFFLFSSVNYRVLIIHIDVDLLTLKFGVFTWAVSMSNIESCALDELPAFMRLGGAGIHFMFIRKRYRASFNFLEYPRVVVTLKKKVGPVQDISFSTQRPDEIQKIIQSIVNKH